MAELLLPPNVRMTPQRRAVLDAVAAQEGAFAVMDVYDLARRVEPSLGLATVYRTVELLRSTGFVQPLAGAGDGTYVRCHPGHHHHLVCQVCGGVEDTTLCGAPSPALLARKHGFTVASHELNVYGTCRSCA
jgi:Fur family ferric uptake transcriptional regulator